RRGHAGNPGRQVVDDCAEGLDRRRAILRPAEDRIVGGERGANAGAGWRRSGSSRAARPNGRRRGLKRLARAVLFYIGAMADPKLRLFFALWADPPTPRSP